MGDVASFADPHFKADADEAVVQGVLAFLDRPGVLVTHSMGTVLGLHALRLLALPAPILCMASPLSNPPVRAALRAIGYGRTPVEPVIHLWNADDPICAPGDQPEYFQATRIAVADNEAAEFSTEHAVELYLRHPHTHNALRLLWERGDG